jgi:hypothetical protein
MSNLNSAQAIDLSGIVNKARQEAAIELEEGDKEKAAQLPKPTGYHILLW